MTFWKYTPKDGILFIIPVLQFILMFWWARNFDQLTWGNHVSLIVLMSFVFYYNPIVVTHNFLHTPFFASNFLNRLFAILNSGNLLLPQVLYKHHHLIHHTYNNDRYKEDLTPNGHTLDPSSTYRFGKNGEQEGMFLYCALGLFRDGTNYAFKRTLEKREGWQLIYQTTACLLTIGLWLYLSWQWFLLCLLPVFLIGWFLAHMENYYEHFRATDPESKFANAVSYYGKIYNIWMFNEGYHQAHHSMPGAHWTKRVEVEERYKEYIVKENAYAAKLPPLLGFLD